MSILLAICQLLQGDVIAASWQTGDGDRVSILGERSVCLRGERFLQRFLFPDFGIRVDGGEVCWSLQFALEEGYLTKDGRAFVDRASRNSGSLFWTRLNFAELCKRLELTELSSSI